MNKFNLLENGFNRKTHLKRCFLSIFLFFTLSVEYTKYIFEPFNRLSSSLLHLLHLIFFFTFFFSLFLITISHICCSAFSLFLFARFHYVWCDVCYVHQIKKEKKLQQNKNVHSSHFVWKCHINVDEHRRRQANRNKDRWKEKWRESVKINTIVMDGT